MADAMDTEFEQALDQDAATKAARTVKLATGSNGVDYLLEPKYGSLRGITCRRTDGVRLRCPEALEGGYTDVRSAQAAVEKFLDNKGKAKPGAPDIPVRSFAMQPPLMSQVIPAAVEEEPVVEVPSLGSPVAEEEELELDPEVPSTVNLSQGKPDPEGETVTQRARRQKQK